MEITSEARALVSQAEHDLTTLESFTITSPVEFQQSADLLKLVKSRYNEIESKRKELVKPIDEAKKGLQDFFNPSLTRLKNAEMHIKSAIASWQNQERLRIAEQERKLRELALKEQQRIDGDALDAATEAHQKGDSAFAEEILNNVPQVGIPAIVSPDNKAQGISMRDNWKYRVIDVNLIPRDYMMPDDKLLTSIAKAKHDGIRIPGVEFYNEPIVSARV